MPLQIPEGIVPSSSDQLVIMGAEFQTLRQTKGHYQGAEFNADADAPNGKKHHVMNQLLQQLGQPGTKGPDIVKIMGPPDEVSENAEKGLHASGAPTMPGPFMDSSKANAAPMYLIYHWRGRHDYMYFKLDKDEKVEKADWYLALE
ncbi:hypothetical protein SeLEV6574_g05351 [Synchytrium endobioticum]|nr:hypothetical protein SeLEV6574_g05351 [Synchytrium endobioticum]